MYEDLKKILEESQNIVFFGGAGVSLRYLIRFSKVAEDREER